TTYVRCIVSNEDGSCEHYGDIYKIDIGNSELNIPNVFSPDGDGINDEWKVSYRSLFDFKCWIFDRQGHQVFYTEDPSIGWDGRRGNNPVRSGVYYYIITATGSDGKRYKKCGDINVLLSKSINGRQ
ncbi:MAG: gliding motility-associated C-terminal domain-containing protein, partial [Muribaculaceae bacterium]|nr:gliding motility-associated C-terminal domain-containing protein [Muribaculaceae bacterium]